jgi:pimeloyl-ACP methyl ester carboxylesterase
MSVLKKILSKSTGLYFNTLAYLLPKKLKKYGFNLFCTPFSRKLRAHHQSFLNTGLAEILTIEGNKIQTYSWGNGSQKVLMVHGWASHSFRWKAYIDALVKNDFTVLALDAPAHGNSTGKIMNIVIYEKVLSDFLTNNKDVEVIIGHSIGAFATTYYLNRNTESYIKKAVVLASPSKVSDFFEYFTQQLGLSKKTISLISEQFETELKQKPNFFSAVDFASKIKIPTLIVHDKTDRFTKWEDSVKLSEAWHGSKLKITEGLGHELKSDELLSEIIKFIKWL